MSLNCSEIDLILKELDLTGSFIQEIVQPSFDTIALYSYKPGIPKTVFISLAAGECRLHEVSRKIPKNAKPLRFNEMLRARIKGAKITECRQLGSERIIKISTYREGPVYVMPAAQQKFARKKKVEEENGIEELNLYIRLWSNAGNIFLCDKNDIILDSFYRRPAKGEMTGEKLSLPEAAETPGESTPGVVSGATSKPVRTFTVRNFVDYRSTLEEEQLKKFDSLSFNEKIDVFYSQSSARSSIESLLEQAEKWYNSHKSRQEAALEKLTDKRAAFLNASQWKHDGDLILSFGYMFTDHAGPDGKNSTDSGFLECTDYDTGKIVRLKVDPKKSAQENAATYYETYKKQNSGLEDLEHDIQLAQRAISELDKQYAQMVSEKNPVKLEQILRKSQTPKQQLKEERPGLIYQAKEWTILVGRDANENDELLRHYVKGPDMWFHTRDYAGGYVFIKARAGKTVPLDIMLIAGNLAVHYSKARKNGEADLYYTQVKHLRRAKNGPKGLVLPSNEKNLHIKLDQAILRRLEDENQ